MYSIKHTPNKRKVVNVVLLDGEQLQVFVDVKSKFSDVFNQVTTHLNLRETEYFGLAFKKDGEFQFVTLDEKIHKQAPKVWKSSHGEGFDSVGQPLLTVHFKVQFYVDQIVLLREKVTRHLYYLQLKENVINYGHLCTEEKSFQIASYALQADFGNFNPAKHGVGYFDPREYFPAWIVQKRGDYYLRNHTPIMHEDLRNITKSEAELRFIREATASPAAYNLHFYRLKKRKVDKSWNAWLGICAKGIEIYEEMEDHFKDLISTFFWPDIGKLYFDKKKFEIRSVGSPEGRKFTYFTDCDTKSKYLLQLCRATHIFQMAIQPKLMEIRHLDAEDKRRYRESYIYSDTRDLVVNGGSFRGSLSPVSKSATFNQRYSVISDASSNTTSGIASEKMTISFEDSDDHTNLCKEILIDCPPRSRSSSNQNTGRYNYSAVNTLPNTMPSSKTNNRSPVLESRPVELYKSASVGRPGGSKIIDRSPTFNRPTSILPPSPGIRHSEKSSSAPSAIAGGNMIGVASVLRGDSDISQNSTYSNTNYTGSRLQDMDISPNNSFNSGGYRTVCQSHSGVVQQEASIYSGPRTVPVYMAHTPVTSFSNSDNLTFSQPVSRSTSRADSFRNTLGHLQVHEAPIQPVSNVESYDPYTGQYLDTLAGNLVYANYPIHTGVGMSMPPQPMPVQSNTTISNLYNPVYTGSGHFDHHSSSEYIDGDNSAEYLTPPPMFADATSTPDSMSEKGIAPEVGVLLSEQMVEKAIPRYLETDLDEEENVGSDKSLDESKSSITQMISVKNQKEILHPELEEIRGQSDGFSLPLITALCNDKSLMHTNSQNGSICSYDASTIRSSDSRVSRLSHDIDPRRFSSCFPSRTGTMISLQPNRPFSWHSESFDLDAQLAAVSRDITIPSSGDNRYSVPQNLDNYSSSTSSWAQAIANSLQYKPSLDRYSPELLATHLMIPPKISSGGHNSSERNISPKPLKETIGIA